MTFFIEQLKNELVEQERLLLEEESREDVEQVMLTELRAELKSLSSQCQTESMLTKSLQEKFDQENFDLMKHKVCDCLEFFSLIAIISFIGML